MSTTKFSSRPIFLFAGAVLLLGGCLDEAAFAPASPEPDDLPDVASAFSTEGLTLSASAPEQVAGTFERRGVSLRFELARDDQGRHLHVARASGEPLLDSTLADGIDTTVLLGGRARLTGAIDEAPAIEGDAAAFELMAAQPELALLPELKEALIARHVDERLYRASPALFASAAAPSGDLKTNRRLAYVTLDAQQWIDVPTWSFWATSRISMIEMSGCSTWVSTTTTQGHTDSYLLQNNSRTVYGQWWGFPVRVSNQNYWVGCQVRVIAD